MIMQKINALVLCISSSAAESNLNENQQENIDIVGLQQVNQLMLTSAITKTAPLTDYFTYLCGKQIRMYNLYTSHRQFANHTQAQISGLMNTDTVNSKYTGKK